MMKEQQSLDWRIAIAILLLAFMVFALGSVKWPDVGTVPAHLELKIE